MTVDRLSALDEGFLRLERGTAHMHIGWTLLLEGEPPTLDELRGHIEGRLDLLPRFRCRVVDAPLRLHDPVWVEDGRFDIANHVSSVSLGSPGLAELRRFTGGFLSVQLDRRRPLWRLQLVTGLGGERFAVVGQAHHALVDGIAAVEMSQLLLDTRAASIPAVPARPFSPAPEPGIVDRTIATASERLRLTRSAASTGLRALANPAALGDGIAQARRLASAFGTIGASSPRTALNRRIGAERTVAFSRLSLPVAKQLGRRSGATVNDVVLATTALALGHHLRRAGESHPWMRVLVPVNTRSAEEDGALGNQISVMFVELPVGERDPRRVLAEVARQTREQKRAAHASALDRLTRVAGIIPPQLRDAIAWVLTRPETFNLVVSNIPGPREPLYLLGRRVQAAYPAVPLMQGHGVSVGVLSYCGYLHVGLYADPNVVPRAVELARDFKSAFDSLQAGLLPPLPRPPVRPPRPRERMLERVYA